MYIFNNINDAIEDIKIGKMIVVVDDENRENEGDLVIAAELVTPESINFMVTHGRGLICVPLLEETLNELEIPQMVQNNTDPKETAFTLSVDHIDSTTGISTLERSHTIKMLTNRLSVPNDFTSPGHIFPLRAKKGGVLTRDGHTEAGVDLSILAGLHPSSVICEILNDDGTMARVPDLMKYVVKHSLKIITIKDLIEYRRGLER